MKETVLLGIYVFVLAIFLGVEVIGRVPSKLHTPLMSGTNAIHGIVVLGAMIVLGAADTWWLQLIGFIAGIVLFAFFMVMPPFAQLKNATYFCGRSVMFLM